MMKILLMKSITAFKMLALIPICIELVISLLVYGIWVAAQHYFWPEGQPEGDKWILLPLAIWAIQLVYFLQVIGIIPKTQNPHRDETVPDEPSET